MKRPPGLDGWHSHLIIRVMSAVNTWLFRRSGGRIGGRFLRGAPVLLLTTTGRKTGQPRTRPLLYLEDGDRLVVVASKGGMKAHPHWYLNLVADPEVEVEVGSHREKRIARTADPEERAALWPRLVQMYADFDSYQSWTDREIPVIVLDQTSGT